MAADGFEIRAEIGSIIIQVAAHGDRTVLIPSCTKKHCSAKDRIIQVQACLDLFFFPRFSCAAFLCLDSGWFGFRHASSSPSSLLPRSASRVLPAAHRFPLSGLFARSSFSHRCSHWQTCSGGRRSRLSSLDYAIFSGCVELAAAAEA